MKIEFLYDKKSDKTNIYIWKSMTLVDTREMNGVVTTEHQKVISDGIKKEYKDK